MTAEQRLTIHAETLAVSTRRIETAVRATRCTDARTVQVEENLVHEQVVVETVPIGRTVEAMPPVRQEGDVTIIPVVEEVVVVERRLVLKEEVRLRRVRTTRPHVETVTLREQCVRISRETKQGGAVAAPTQPAQKESSMSEETIVAVFDTVAHAELAVQDLRVAGIPESAISRHDSGAHDLGAHDLGVHDSGALDSRPAAVPGSGMEPGRGFWSTLFGGEPDHDTAVYDRSIQGGSTVVTVVVDAAHAARVADILESHRPIDLDERATSFGLAPVDTGVRAEPRGTGDTMQLSEEQLQVGKRLVNRGGTRIRRFVREIPVEEQVTLRDETVRLERRPVTDGRPVSDADFTDQTIEMTEVHEEAVVAKTARVVEEVALRKDTTERVETVRDTVRREDVKVESLPGDVPGQLRPTTAPLPTRTP